MEIWQALQYVGTGLSLVAFVVAAILLAYRARLTNRAEIINSAPEKERLEAIAATKFMRSPRCACCPTGRLAPASDDNMIRLWDVARGAEAASLEKHAGPITALCVLPDGQGRRWALFLRFCFVDFFCEVLF
jgi:WD40 repeat protein